MFLKLRNVMDFRGRDQLVLKKRKKANLNLVGKHNYYKFAGDNDQKKIPRFLKVVKKKFDHRAVKSG